MSRTYTKRLAVLFTLALAAGNALANCWADPNVIGLANNIAQNKFPNTARQMPDIFVCADHVFPQNIGGQYTGGAHQISLPVRSLSQDLRSILAHELAHAEVALLGGSGGGSTAGHGRDWMRVMLGAGETAEAQRVAGYYQQQGGYSELAIAQQSFGQYLPRVFPDQIRPPMTYQPVCIIHPVLKLQRLNNGALVQLVVNAVSCQ